MVASIASSQFVSWLDPCCGKGAFLKAMASHEVVPQNVTAIDLVRESSLDTSLAGQFICDDFLNWAATTGQQFDRIVANPPYVGLRRLRSPLRETALAVKELDGKEIGLGANYWFVFLCASVALLRPGGSLCFVLPAAWDYARYSASFRRQIGEKFGEVEIHRCLEPMFEDVKDGSIVLVAKQYAEQNRYVKRYRHKAPKHVIAALNNRQTVSEGRQLSNTHKDSSCSVGEGRLLSDILRIRLGGVTGDVGYFLMSERQRRKLRLPICSVRPVVSKARHLVSATITRTDWKRLCVNSERVWLFDPPPRARRSKTVNAYLRLEKSEGGCDRRGFKIHSRNPWYRTPMPRKVDGFISGMSRLGPWISFNGMTGLNATNTLYTVEFKGSSTSDERAAWALSLLTTQARKALREVRRVYPDRLIKYEPGDLLKVRLNVPPRVNGASARYASIVRMILTGDLLRARKQADLWFEG
jgi:adenine-specific DNA-methyltransferase